MSIMIKICLALTIFISAGVKAENWFARTTLVENVNRTFVLWFEGEEGKNFKEKFFGVVSSPSWTHFNNFDFKEYDEYYNSVKNIEGTKNCKYYYIGPFKGTFKCFAIIKM